MLGLGFILSFNDHYALVFNLFLSIAALEIAGLILVNGRGAAAVLDLRYDGAASNQTGTAGLLGYAGQIEGWLRSGSASDRNC